MGIFERLSQQAEWYGFYEYKKEQGNLPKKLLSELLEYIEQQKYIPVVEKILAGGTLSYPQKSLINKSKAGRKRAVYTFAADENYLLKLMAYLLRRYDNIFAPNLYSFRKDRGVKRATEDILRIRNLNQRYVYKLDISDYFNSVDIDILLPKLKAALSDDPALYEFIKGLLECPKVVFDGEITEEKKGIMAGVPISGFLADLYLYELDWYFYNKGIPYMRYSDDIIVFAEDEVTLRSSVERIKDTLQQHKLNVNSEKEVFSEPGTPWNFLGFSYDKGIIDISDVSFEKLKAKMKRKARSLERWAARKQLPGTLAARAFIKRFNTKLYDNPIHNELTWTKWYFPVINTDVTLKAIDEYMQECIRYLATGKRTKAKYNFKYSDIKSLGYRSLVNEYYKRKNTDS
ncbi:MAG: hypothetical protein IJB24_08745, partial [Clostridia bacterium]|nr:hypothetical protein [Clostridia bacterium]